MKNSYRYFFLLFCSLLTNLGLAQNADSLSAQQGAGTRPVELAAYQLNADAGGLVFAADVPDGSTQLNLNGDTITLNFQSGQARHTIASSPEGELLLLRNGPQSYRLFHLAERSDGSLRLRHIPLWLSLLPPLIAIVLALIFKEVVVSLFVGIWLGAFIAGGMRIESFYYLLLSLFHTVEHYIIQALADAGHLSIIVFSMLIGGMVAIISRNGGMAGVVLAFSRYARSPKSAQLITWALVVVQSSVAWSLSFRVTVAWRG